MKDKYDWFDDNWNPDVKLSTIILELLLSPTYCWPMRVTEACVYKRGAAYPKCQTTFEREYQRFCDRCGQRFNRSKFKDAKKAHIGRDRLVLEDKGIH